MESYQQRNAQFVESRFPRKKVLEVVGDRRVSQRGLAILLGLIIEQNVSRKMAKKVADRYGIELEGKPGKKFGTKHSKPTKNGVLEAVRTAEEIKEPVEKTAKRLGISPQKYRRCLIEFGLEHPQIPRGPKIKGAPKRRQAVRKEEELFVPIKTKRKNNRLSFARDVYAK